MAKTTASAPVDPGESVNMSVEKIDNGYLMRKSRYGDGAYESSTVYSKERPTLEAEAKPSVPKGPNPLQRAIAKLK